MKNFFSSLVLVFLFAFASHAQQAPPHLKYFGFAVIDCYWDDPHDNTNITNYISEVDSFSNINQLCVYSHTDNVTGRVTLMNQHCSRAMLSVQSIFYYYADTTGPSGANYDLYSDYVNRWNLFKQINLSVLDTQHIACFYIVDEPAWNGVDYNELDSVCTLLQNDFPSIPIMTIEAYPAVSAFRPPPSMDWIGFDRYGVYDPEFDLSFRNDLDTIKSHRTDPSQKIFLIIDDQWLPYYGLAGYAPDTMKHVVQNYYDLAAADTSIIGLVGYIWPGGLDDPGHLGVRDLPQSVINKNVTIGKMILQNSPPCIYAGVQENANEKFQLYPNPARESFHLRTSFSDYEFCIYDSFGRLVMKEHCRNQDTEISISSFPDGIYHLLITGEKIYSRRLVVVH